jgi:hypothetical protein
MRVNRRVSIWKHVRLADGKWRYCRPVLDAKGKIVPDMVTVLQTGRMSGTIFIRLGRLAQHQALIPLSFEGARCINPRYHIYSSF